MNKFAKKKDVTGAENFEKRKLGTNANMKSSEWLDILSLNETKVCHT